MSLMRQVIADRKSVLSALILLMVAGYSTVPLAPILEAQTDAVTITVTDKRYPFPFRGSGTNWEGIEQDRFGTGSNDAAARALFGDSGLKLRVMRLWLAHNNMRGKSAYEYYYGAVNSAIKHGATEIWGTGIPGNSNEMTVNIDAETTRWLNVIKDIRSRGGRFNGLDFCNKPNTNYSGCGKHTPEEVAQGVAMMRQKLDAAGLEDVEVIGPSTVEWWPRPAPNHAVKYDYQEGDSMRYINAIANSPAALQSISAFSTQTYGMGVTEEMYAVAERTGKNFYTMLNATDPPNNGSIVAGQFLSDVNHGVTMWVYWLAYSGGTGTYGAMAGLKPFNHVFDVGAYFYKMNSSADADMHFNYGTHDNVIAASAVNPDKSWAVGLVNMSGIRSQHYSSSFSGGRTKTVVVHIPELEGKGAVTFTKFGGGTVVMTNGRMTITLSPRSFVALRSPAGISSDLGATTGGTTGTTGTATTGGTTGSATPAPCNTISSGTNAPTGYAQPWNVLTSARELLVSVTCTNSSAELTVGTGVETQYVYKLAYEYRGTGWQQIALTGANLVSDAWYAGSQGKATLPRTSAELSQSNFVVGYVCNWTGETTGWKCGCADAACASPLWQLQIFRR